jgi:uncharacterized protein (DUF2235 family)
MTKNLIVFCDGTWNRADQSRDGRPCPTNVLRMFEATRLTDDAGTPQVAHYIEGVGTRWSERLLGGGFGYGISDNIKNGYQFVVSNYEPGDRIFLFGFSRGAYTARSLAGLIFNMGVLKRHETHLVSQAYRLYKSTSKKWHPDSDASKEFRSAHTHGGETIACLGIWDTVGALGAPFGRFIGEIVDALFQCRFHDVKLSRIVESAYHALAIHEKRWTFRPTRWELNADQLAANARRPDDPLFEEEWFDGVHSNVGGGYPDTGLADLSLKWMAKRAAARGLRIDLGALCSPACRPNRRGKREESQTFLSRLTTVLFVKLPRALSRKPVADEDMKLIAHIRWNGDYIRPRGAPKRQAPAKVAAPAA